MESVKIPASKMAARNRVQYHPPPPISVCEGPRIIQKLEDVVVQILELPLSISILFDSTNGHADHDHVGVTTTICRET